MPTGSGLLSANLFGGELGLVDKSEGATTGPNIVLHINLNEEKNKVINFARLAEEKYGFAALYPRQAAQRERLARVAAAGAALERSGSGSKVNSAGESGDDDGSVDIDRDSEGDGDVAMGGLNGTGAGNSGTEGEPKKVKRRKKVEEYDLDDDFVDDSEQVWEAQAATSKEGFFVYCGPLVAEGEKPTIERYALQHDGVRTVLIDLLGLTGQSSVVVVAAVAVGVAQDHAAGEVLARRRPPRATLPQRRILKSDPRRALVHEEAKLLAGPERRWRHKTTDNKWLRRNPVVEWRELRPRSTPNLRYSTHEQS